MRPESALQRGCVRWFRIQHHQYAPLLFAIPNGARLHGDTVARAKQWSALAKEGAVPGAPDLFLAIPGKLGAHGLFIEMKTPDGTQTKEQRAFEIACTSKGYGYIIPRSLSEFIDIINEHLSHD